MHIRILHLFATAATIASATTTTTTAASATTTTNLFISDYSGSITTLSLTSSQKTTQHHHHHHHHHLLLTHQTNGCAPNPSWLTLDPTNHNILYCMDEGLDIANGSLSSYGIGFGGKLTRIHREDTVEGPVSGVVFGGEREDGGRAIALAHYTGSALSTFNLSPRNNSNNSIGTFSPLQTLPFTLKTPGPNTERQSSPHLHQVLLDPTNKFILVPDLGADLIRVFSFSSSLEKTEEIEKTETEETGNDGLVLVEEEALAVLPGSGPRHAVFYRPLGGSSSSSDGDEGDDGDDETFLFVVAELANTVTSYRVEYPETGGMRFSQVYNSTVYGELNLPEGNSAAEIAISPDNRFLIISNRNNTSFTLPPPPSAHGSNTDHDHDKAKIPSDSLSTFSLHPNGTLSFLQLWPSGGMYPRHFSLNKHGDLLAVGLEHDDAVVVMQRNVESGLLGRPVARMRLGGNVTCVMWGE